MCIVLVSDRSTCSISLPLEGVCVFLRFARNMSDRAVQHENFFHLLLPPCCLAFLLTLKKLLFILLPSRQLEYAREALIDHSSRYRHMCIVPVSDRSTCSISLPLEGVCVFLLFPRNMSDRAVVYVRTRRRKDREHRQQLTSKQRIRVKSWFKL